MPDYAATMRESNKIDTAVTTLAEAVGEIISLLGDWAAGTVRWLWRRAT